MNRLTMERLAKRLAEYRLKRSRPNQVFSPYFDLAVSLIFFLIGIYDRAVLPFAIAIFILIAGVLRFQIVGLILLLEQSKSDAINPP